MKKFYSLLCMLIAAATISNAQSVANYHFASKSNVPLADMSANTAELIGAYADEISSAVNPIGFSFRFNNVAYTSFSVTENGYLGLGQDQIEVEYINGFVYDQYNPFKIFPFPIIAPWWEDLYTASNGRVAYRLMGTPGNQKLVVEWRVVGFTEGLSTYNKTFQLWLFEGSNKIQFVYGQGYVDFWNGGTIGIAASSSNFLSYDITSNSVSTQQSFNDNEVWPVANNSLIFAPSTITEQPVFTPVTIAENTVLNNITCPGANNGSITLGSFTGGNGSYSISWTGPSGFSASTSVLTNLAPGMYSYQVTDGAGSPSATGSFQILEPATTLENTYALVALKSISLGENNLVKGSVGTTLATTGKVSVNKNTTIKGFIKSPVITVQTPSIVTQGSFNVVSNITMPVVLSNTSNISGLSNLNIPDDYAGGPVSGNYKDVSVGKRATVIFKGNVFGKISIKEGADVKFDANDISLNELQTESGKVLSVGIDYTTCTFLPNAIVRVKSKLNIADRNQVMATGATFYMSDNNPDAEKITVSGKLTTFSGNVIMPIGKMSVKSADANNVATINGMIIAEEIISDKFVNWNRSVCSETATRPSGGSFEAIVAAEQKLSLFPNPASGLVSVKPGKNLSANAMVIVYNQDGKIVMQRKIADAGGQNISLNLVGNAPGIYLVKLINGTEIQSTKLVLNK